MQKSACKFVSLRVEELEARTLMAGNVTAIMSGGNLTLSGDTLGNEIQAYQTAPGTYRIVGNPGTTVNGASAFTASGVTGDVKINMGAGDDFVQLMMVVPGNLNIDMGSGNDFLSLGGFFELPPGAQSLPYAVDVKGGLTVNSQAGNDVLNIFDSRVAGATSLVTGSENDRVTLLNTRFLNTLDLDTGSGDDSVDIGNISVTGKANLQTGSGNDAVTLKDSAFSSDLTLDGGSGTGDSLMKSGNLFAKPVTIKGFEIVS